MSETLTIQKISQEDARRLLNSSDVSVEVLDLDCPEFVTEEEQFDFDAKEKQVEEMEQSPDWISVW